MIGHHYFFFIFVVLLLLFFDGIAVSALVSAFKIGLLEFRAELLELFVGLFEVVVVVKLQRLLLRVTSSRLVVACRANGIGTFVTISGVPSTSHSSRLVHSSTTSGPSVKAGASAALLMSSIWPSATTSLVLFGGRRQHARVRMASRGFWT